MAYRIAIVILTGLSLALAAPPPPKVVDIYRADSDPALAPLPPGFSYAVAPFGFSPDEQWIGVTLYVGALKPGVNANPNTTLLLLPLHPADRRRVEIDSVTRSTVLWSPDSESVVVQALRGRRQTRPEVYDLQGKLTRTGPPSGPLLGFIAPGRLLALHAKANGRLAGFDVIDIRTSAVTSWRAPRRGHFAAMDSARGLVALSPDSESSRTLIVDYATGKVAQSINSQNQTFFLGSPCYGVESTICDLNTFAAPKVYFAENGRTLCEAAAVGGFRNYPVCRDVDTGKTIAEFRGVDGGAPSSVSTGGSRMVLSKINYLPGGPGAETYSGTVVWDFRADTEVAAWEPISRRAVWMRAMGAGGFSAPVFAISASGKYVAEAFGDELHIYQLP